MMHCIIIAAITVIHSMASTQYSHRLVSVTSSARLHMGFFDLNGAIGRKFGSIGLSLRNPALTLQLKEAERSQVIDVPPNAREIKQKLDQFCQQLKQLWGLSEPLSIQLSAALPRHAGLGSGTQLALTIGTAIARLYDLPVTTREIALATGRGGRSGIGIAAFDQGGVLIDGGRRQAAGDTCVPPLLARYDFPEQWQVLLIEDQSLSGVHGSNETSAFKTLPVFSNDLSARLSHEVLMKAMPALVEQDLQSFGESIQVLQAVTGDHFAPIQGGRYASTNVTHALKTLEEAGVACFGQSSWGPTGFAIFANAESANQHLTLLKQKHANLPLSWQLTTVNNAGAEIKVEDT